MSTGANADVYYSRNLSANNMPCLLHTQSMSPGVKLMLMCVNLPLHVLGNIFFYKTSRSSFPLHCTHNLVILRVQPLIITSACSFHPTAWYQYQASTLLATASTLPISACANTPWTWWGTFSTLQYCKLWMDFFPPPFTICSIASRKWNCINIIYTE